MINKYQEIGQYIDLGFFVWRVSNAGYYIDNNAEPDETFCKGDKPKGPFIVEKPETTGYLTTKPLDENLTLFLEFADLDGSEESFVDFANKHGQLTTGMILTNISHDKKYNVKIDEDEETVTTSYKFICGTPLNFWQNEHFILKSTVQVWNWLKSNDIEKLNLVIRWYNNNKKVKYFLGSDIDLKAYHLNTGEHYTIIKGELASETNPPGLLSRFIPGDVILPAQTVIQKEINQKLKDYPVNPVLLMDKYNKLKQYLMPSSLLSAMWFQFFQAVSGEKKYKRCEVCMKWEDVTNKKSSWTKHPECAGRVRTANYRKRIADIKELYSQGVLVSDIAKQFGISEKQINKWIKGE